MLGEAAWAESRRTGRKSRDSMAGCLAGYWVLDMSWDHLKAYLGKSSDRWMNLQLVIYKFSYNN